MSAALAAARVGDPIEHTSSLMGFLVGAAVGLAVGAAMVAATVATGGAALAVVASVGAGIMTAGGMAQFGQVIGSLFGKVTGAIIEGASTVTTNNIPSACVKDKVQCSKHSSKPPLIGQGSAIVFIEGQPAARKTDAITCGATIKDGSPDTFIGDDAATYLAIASEVPTWMTDLASAAMKYGGYIALAAGGLSILASRSACLLIKEGGGYLASMALEGTAGAAGEYIGGQLGGPEWAAKGRLIGESSGAVLGLVGGRRSLSGHPIDVTSGELLCEHTDFQLPGPLPLVWHRRYISSSVLDSDLGHKWHHPLDMSLTLRTDTGQAPSDTFTGDERIIVRLSDGRAALFNQPKPKQPCINTHEQLILHRTDAGYSLQTLDGLYYDFDHPERDDRDGIEAVYRLACLRDSRDHRITLTYNAHHQLSQITDSVGRELTVVRSSQGQWIKQITLHNPETHETEALVRYQYTGEGDLSTVTDGCGHQAHCSGLMISY